MIGNDLILAAVVVPWLIYTAVAAAISYGAYLLLRKKPPMSPLDQSNVDPSIRGSICKYVLGIRRLSPIVGWVGNTWAQEVEVEGGGKGGGDNPKKTVYHQSAMHIICLGLGNTLFSIYERGVKIFDESITRVSHPSGSTLSCTGGTFRIYWGEASQPVDSNLEGYTGTTCAYNNIMYIVWDRKRLGDQKIWPVIEYKIKIDLQFSTLFGNSVWLSETQTTTDYSGTISTGVDTARDVTGALTSRLHFISLTDSVMDIPLGANASITYGGNTYESYVTYASRKGLIPNWDVMFKDPIPNTFASQSVTLKITTQPTSEGLNVAAIVYQLLFEVFPFGLGLDTSSFNLTDLEDVFDTLGSGSSLALPASIILADKKSIRDGIGQLLMDAGVGAFWDMATHQYRFKVMKVSDTPTEISSDAYSLDKGSDTEEVGYSVLEAQQRHYTFFDSNRNFEQSSIMVTDDNRAKYAKFPNSKAVGLYTITDLDTAAVFASRRDREFYVRGGIKVVLSMSIMDSQIANVYTFEDLTGEYRLAKLEPNPLKSNAKATFLKDYFSSVTSAIPTTPSVTVVEGTDSAYPDIQFRLLETNKYYDDGKNGVYVWRVRNGSYSTSAAIYLSPDNTSYTQVAITTKYATGGVLVEALSDDTSTIITTGPKVTIYGPDANYIGNLTGNDYEWKAGKQIVVINNELFYVQKLTPTAEDNEYTLDGLIRARQGTNVASHSIGDEVYISLASDLDLITDPMILFGTTLYAKSVPFTVGQAIDISDVTAESISYTGGGFKPLPCLNLFSTGNVDGWVTGEDLPLDWQYRNVAGGAGAGLFTSDEPYSAPSPDGQFELVITSAAAGGGTVYRTEVVTSPAFTYTQAMMTADYGSEPNYVYASIYAVSGGIRSERLSTTFEKV
jgi:hypothetical protein